MANGLFWTVPADKRDLRVSRDGRRAVLEMHDVPVLDSFQFFSPNQIPAEVSFRIEWRASGPFVRRGSGNAVPPTDPAAFLGDIAPARSTASCTGKEWGFAFRSNQATTKLPGGCAATRRWAVRATASSSSRSALTTPRGEYVVPQSRAIAAGLGAPRELHRLRRCLRRARGAARRRAADRWRPLDPGARGALRRRARSVTSDGKRRSAHRRPRPARIVRAGGRGRRCTVCLRLVPRLDPFGAVEVELLLFGAGRREGLE